MRINGTHTFLSNRGFFLNKRFWNTLEKKMKIFKGRKSPTCALGEPLILQVELGRLKND